MKVLIVTQYYPPHVGGLEVVAQKQAKSLAALGHQVTVVTCSSPGADPGDRLEGDVIVRRARALNYLDRRFGLPFAFPYPSLFRKIKEEARWADVIELHDVFYPTCWLGYLAAIYYRKPLLLLQHVGTVAHPSKLVCLAQDLVYKTIGAAIFRASDRIVVFNGNVKSFLLGKGVAAEKISELRNGVSLTEFAPRSRPQEEARIRDKFGLSSTKPIALFVGRLVPKKGYNIVLEAADDTFQLVLAGSGEIPVRASISESVCFTGPLTHIELRELYQVSDVFVLPTSGEVFTVAMQEAMASGIPIVTSDDPGYAHFPLDRSLLSLVQPNFTEVRQAIHSVLQDAQRRAKMAAYSRRTAERWFDWEANFLAFESILRGVVTWSASKHENYAST